MKTQPMPLRGAAHLLLALALLGTGTTALAVPVVIDFEAFSFSPLPPAASEDGYALTSLGTGGIITPPGYGAPPPAGPSVGYAPLDPQSAPDLDVARLDGRAFRLLGFNLMAFLGGAPIPTTVTGFLGGAVVGVESFVPALVAAPPAPALPLLTPTTLAGVTVDRLLFDMGSGFTSGPVVLDNITLSAIPEPGTMLLAGLALGLGGWRRRVAG